jgi:hypothetical protein
LASAAARKFEREILRRLPTRDVPQTKPELQAKARAANRRLLTIQRAGQGCAVSTTLFERVALPSLEEGQRTGDLRFGIRAQWPWSALCVSPSTP